MKPGRLTVCAPRETAEHLDNPERGFYVIRSFTLSDELDCAFAIENAFRWEEGEALLLAEFNLCRYSSGEISPAGLTCLDSLLRALTARGKQMIVRFVYDLEGKNLQTEPHSRAVVERHMEQTGAVLRRYAGNIFTLQGLFTGNWGEMNGTRYVSAENLRALAQRLDAAAGGELLLSVRTPAQWRRIVPYGAQDSGAAARLGLFNDGILGSASDLGTYGERERAEATWEDAWRREDELAFQDELCRRVPNGGEAVSGMKCGLSYAVDTLRRQRVSYLNRDYDRAVLERWAGETFQDRGAFRGADGLTYVGEHLGYRFVLERPRLSLGAFGKRLRGTVKLRNVGFAPAYHALRAELVLTDDAGRELRRVPLDGDPRSLAGGTDDAQRLTLRWDVELTDDEAAQCRISVRVRSEKYGCGIRLGNTGMEPGGGYLIGRIDRK